MGGLGNKGGSIMYHFIDDKDFLKEMRRTCSDIVNQLVQSINNEDILHVKAEMVGSGAKNLETQNASRPVDLDYNLNVIKSKVDINDGREIKEYIKNKFNDVLQKNGWGDCQDSTSCLTTEKKAFKTGNKTQFSIDLAIVNEGPSSWHRLIHRKTGNVSRDEWYWNESPDSKALSKKVDCLKDNNLWDEVRSVYLEKKNLYLKRNDADHPSFICYIEAVNEVYNKYQ